MSTRAIRVGFGLSVPLVAATVIGGVLRDYGVIRAQELNRKQYNRDAGIAWSQHDYARAEQLFKSAIEAAEAAKSTDKIYITSLKGAASMLQVRGDFAGATDPLKKALEALEALHGPQSENVVEALRSLGRNEIEQCNFTGAEPFLRKAIAVNEQLPRPLAVEPARTLNELADVCVAQGKYVEAKAIYEHSLATVDHDNPFSSDALNGLARTYLAQGQEYEAEPLLRRALDIIHENPLQNEPLQAVRQHENLALSCNLSGHTADSTGALERASGSRLSAMELPRYEHDLDWWQRVLQRRADAASRAEDKGGAYLKEGKYHEAAACFRLAADEFGSSLGPHHASVAQAFEKLAQTLRTLGRAAEAGFWEQRAAVIRQTSVVEKNGI